MVGPEAPWPPAWSMSSVPRPAHFSPTRAAAQLETPGLFKAFMQRHGIPTANYQTFSDPAAAHACDGPPGAPIVVKADGLAAARGVVVAMSRPRRTRPIDFMLVDNRWA